MKKVGFEEACLRRLHRGALVPVLMAPGRPTRRWQPPWCRHRARREPGPPPAPFPDGPRPLPGVGGGAVHQRLLGREGAGEDVRPPA